MRALAIAVFATCVSALDISAAAEPRNSSPPASWARSGPEGILVTVKSVSFAGLDGLWVGEGELLAAEVVLAWDKRRRPAGYVAPRVGLQAARIPLWALGGYDRRGVQIYGSGLEAICADLARFLRARGIAHARVELAERAIRHLATPGSDGLLMLDVEH